MTTYTPAFQHVYAVLGGNMPVDVFCETVGKVLFDNPRDVYNPINLSVRFSGNASSPKGSLLIPVVATDSTWFEDTADAIGEMIDLTGDIDLRDECGETIRHMTPEQLALAGEVDVYVNDARFRAPVFMSYELPRAMSSKKQEHIGEWYDTHVDSLCDHVADTMKNWSVAEIKANVQDGGPLERAICAFIEARAPGPSNETWPVVISTYGMDKLACSADAHRSAQDIAKEVTGELCTMLDAAKDQILLHEASKNAQGGAQKSAQRRLWEDLPQHSIDSDMDSRTLYHEIATDAFHTPALRDRVTMLIYRQPLHRAPKHGAKTGTVFDKLGNPIEAHQTECFYPYYSAYPVEVGDRATEAPYSGNFKRAMAMYHLFTGRHMLPQKAIGETILEPIPDTRKRAPLAPIECPSKDYRVEEESSETSEEGEDEEDKDMTVQQPIRTQRGKSIIPLEACIGTKKRSSGKRIGSQMPPAQRARFASGIGAAKKALPELVPYKKAPHKGIASRMRTQMPPSGNGAAKKAPQKEEEWVDPFPAYDAY